ncbi:6-pyruvoyl tetrahydrobiopterin synthase [Candidatus Marinamargulisbacteria bacterium SCGC AAA071-K20]|nr:6-pyruvoyl tetrahydrobiopterin synthase [Candidatus Marinamargulisbacteria bacterium SCGC AAA071-K20]
MSKVFLVRKEHFCASHRLHSDALSDEENKRIFDKCNNKNGHGHNYTLEVTVHADIDSNTGMIINLVDLKEIIKKWILDPFDHKHLNLDTEEFKSVNPTVENMVLVFWGILIKTELNSMLYEVRLFETENNIAYYRG